MTNEEVLSITEEIGGLSVSRICCKVATVMWMFLMGNEELSCKFESATICYWQIVKSIRNISLISKFFSSRHDSHYCNNHEKKVNLKIKATLYIGRISDASWWILIKTGTHVYLKCYI